MLELSDHEFYQIKDLVYSLIGLHLNDSKKMLVSSRLAKRLRVLNLSSISEYIKYLKENALGNTETIELINSITTNKTDFFRENHHFNFLKTTFIPNFIASKSHNLRIWSAGCSSGEEPYTLAMVFHAAFKSAGTSLASQDFKLLASDVDTSVLGKAKAGVYKLDALKDIPAEYQHSYLDIQKDNFQIRKELKQLITFGRFNLTHPFPFKNGFDIIFCRNVLIYFKQEDRLKIISKFQQVLRPQGYLILGHSESLLADQFDFKNLGNTIYRKLGN